MVSLVTPDKRSAIRGPALIRAIGFLAVVSILVAISAPTFALDMDRYAASVVANDLTASMPNAVIREVRKSETYQGILDTQKAMDHPPRRCVLVGKPLRLDGSRPRNAFFVTAQNNCGIRRLYGYIWVVELEHRVAKILLDETGDFLKFDSHEHNGLKDVVLTSGMKGTADIGYYAFDGTNFVFEEERSHTFRDGDCFNPKDRDSPDNPIDCLKSNLR